MNYLDAKNIFLTSIMSYCAMDTIKYYTLNLELFERFLKLRFDSLDFDVSKLTKQHFVDYITHCRTKNVKNTSVRTYARAIKVFLRFLFNEGYIDTNITQNVRFPKSDKKQIVPLSYERVKRLCQQIDKNPNAFRNRAIFSLMLDCGLRVGEVVRLNIDEIDFEYNKIAIVDTKNSKSRIVPLPSSVRFYIIRYLESLGIFDFDVHQPLFRDRFGQERIKENCIKVFVNRLKKIDSDIHCHLLRHTFATSFVMGGGQIECLRLLMGHESYDITRDYLHLSTQMQIIGFDIYRLDGCMFRMYNTYDGKCG